MVGHGWPVSCQENQLSHGAVEQYFGGLPHASGRGNQFDRFLLAKDIVLSWE